MALQTKTFVSKFKNHRLVMVPTRRVMEDGMSYAKQGKTIQFENHRYITSDKAEIDFLTKHKLFSVDIIEEKTQKAEE